MGLHERPGAPDRPEVAVILCGGRGTRLREESEFRPKPMVEVGGKPILWHIMKILASSGIRKFVICIGYRGQMIKDYFLHYWAFNSDITVDLGREGVIATQGQHPEADWTVTVAETGLETNTGGRIHRVRRYLGDTRFVVTYGDGLADIDLGELLSFHESHGRMATMTTVRPAMRFGVAEVSDASRVRTFSEKPRSNDWVSAGFFVFEPSFLDYLDDEAVLELEPLQHCAKDDHLMAYRHTGFWQPMDTFRELQVLEGLWNSGDPPWKVWDR